MRNLNPDMRAKKQVKFNSLCLQFDTLKGMEKIIRESAFDKKK